MIFSDYKKSVLSKRMLLIVSKNFLVVLGVVSVFLGILVIEVPGVLQYGWIGYGGIILFGLITATSCSSIEYILQANYLNQ